MAVFNALVRRLIDALLGPFQNYPAMVTLLPISVVVTVAALLVLKRTSNQEALNRVKAKTHAGIFEIRLFNDDMRTIFSAQRNILVQVAKQIGLTLVPLLWMLVPMAVLLPQLQFQYGYLGIEPGEPVLLIATLDAPLGADETKPDFHLETPTGVRAETGPIWVPAKNELVWRLVADERGSFELLIVDGGGGKSVTKSLEVSDQIRRRSPRRVTGFWSQIAYPAESPLPPDAPFREISLAYRDAEVSLFGWETNWMIAFFLLTLLFAFALRGPLGVTF